MADLYLDFAADYDWLSDDDGLADGGALNYPARDQYCLIAVPGDGTARS